MRIVLSRDPSTVTIWLDTGVYGEYLETVLDADTAEGLALNMLIDSRRAKAWIAAEKHRQRVKPL